MNITFGRSTFRSLASRSLVNLSATVCLLVAAQFLLAQNTRAVESVSKSNHEITVLTSLPVTYFLASSLATDTNIKVLNLPKRGRRLNGQANYFESKAEKLSETFKAASAVVTIGKLWRDDPLFSAARSANIRIVEIDATKPWSNTLEGVSIAMKPHQDAPWATPSAGEEEETAPSIFFWLSLANSARSAEIIAQDLMRLVPEMEAKIKSNLAGLRGKLLELQRQSELALLSAADITVFSLAPELVYFTSEQNLFVDGSFYKQDIDWTEADAADLEKHLKDKGIGAVLHKWEPAEPISKAIKAADAKLVIIETLDAGIVKKGSMLADSYFTLMEANLASLRTALINQH